jgi:hypothetical protein
MRRKRNKSLYTQSDKRTIAELLRWLNKAASQLRELYRIKDGYKRGKAWAPFVKSDPRLKIIFLVSTLNFTDRMSGKVPRKYLVSSLASTNEELKDCEMFPQIRGLGQRKRVVYWSCDPRVLNKKLRAYYTMIPAVLSLHERGLLSAVRDCKSAACMTWFFARHGKSRFHANRCKSAHHFAKLSPEAKARRAEELKKRRARKMGEYRALERERGERALQRAKEWR